MKVETRFDVGDKAYFVVKKPDGYTVIDGLISKVEARQVIWHHSIFVNYWVEFGKQHLALCQEHELFATAEEAQTEVDMRNLK